VIRNSLFNILRFVVFEARSALGASWPGLYTSPMGAFGTIRFYFRVHPWQRRIMTGLLAVIVGVVVALPLYPILRDRTVIGNLHSQDPIQREQAVRQTIWLATQTDDLSAAKAFLKRLEPVLLADLGSGDQTFREQAIRIATAICADPRPPRQPSPAAKAFAGRLEAALDGADDARFMGLCSVLRSLGLLHQPLRTPLQMDRYDALTLMSSQQSPNPLRGVLFRQGIANELIGCDRDNKYVWQAMAALATDPTPELRCYGSILAAKLGDDAMLTKLLSDKSPQVQECAAIDAGFAGRKAVGARIPEVMEHRASNYVADTPKASDADGDLAASCAYALTCMGEPNHFFEWETWAWATLDRPVVNGAPSCLERFEYVASLLGGSHRRPLCGAIFLHFAPLDRAISLYAAGKLDERRAAPTISALLAHAVKPGTKVTEGQLLAALGAAYELRLPCRKEARDICEQLWGPDRGLMLLAAVKLLEQQATLPQPAGSDAPTLEQCFSTLYKAEMFSVEMPAPSPQTQPATAPATTNGPTGATGTPYSAHLWSRTTGTGAPSTAYPWHPGAATAPSSLPATLPVTGESSSEDSRPQVVTTPVPSAAAAMALWRLGAPMGEQALRDAIEGSDWLPGEYVAWHLAMDREADALSTGAGGVAATFAATQTAGERGRTNRGHGTQVAAPFALGLAMLPALDCPPKLRVYDDQEKAAGAMLLALSAGGSGTARQDDEQRRVALERIASRRAGGKSGPERDFYLHGAYDCASLILGDRSFLPRVQEKLGTSFPERRCLTALLAAHDKGALDWLFLNPQLTEEDIRQHLVDEVLYEVIEAAVPELPKLTICGSKELMQWQVRLMIHYYAIHHAQIVPSLPTASPVTTSLPATGPAK
jgi:hypothetical protein